MLIVRFRGILGLVLVRYCFIKSTICRECYFAASIFCSGVVCLGYVRDSCVLKTFGGAQRRIDSQFDGFWYMFVLFCFCKGQVMLLHSDSCCSHLRERISILEAFCFVI